MQTEPVKGAPLLEADPIRPSVQYAEAVPTVQGHHPPHAIPTLTAVPNATVIQVIQIQEFGPYPARIVCPYCRCDVMTTVSAKPSLTAHIWALGLCVFGCWPCCVVPYFVNECQSHAHFCPACGEEVGYHGM